MDKQTKACKRCGVEKPLWEFYKSGKYYQSYCHPCKREYHKIYNEKYNEKYPEKKRLQNKRYRENNRGKTKEYARKYYEKNKEKLNATSVEWAKNNSEKYRARQKKYTEKNKEKIREYQKAHRKQINKRQKDRRKVDSKFRLNRTMSSAIGQSLKRNGGSKNDRHWCKMVGYSVEELEKRLIETMPDGYTWQDFMDGKLHIDHIIPISAHNFSSTEHQDFRRCWALENLQLLHAKENMEKHTKLETSFQPNLALQKS